MNRHSWDFLHRGAQRRRGDTRREFENLKIIQFENDRYWVLLGANLKSGIRNLAKHRGAQRRRGVTRREFENLKIRQFENYNWGFLALLGMTKINE